MKNVALNEKQIMVAYKCSGQVAGLLNSPDNPPLKSNYTGLLLFKIMREPSGKFWKATMHCQRELSGTLDHLMLSRDYSTWITLNPKRIPFETATAIPARLEPLPLPYWAP